MKILFYLLLMACSIFSSKAELINKINELECSQNLMDRVGFSNLGVHYNRGNSFQNYFWAQDQIGGREIDLYLKMNKIKLEPVPVGMIDSDIHLNSSIKTAENLKPCIDDRNSCSFMKSGPSLFNDFKEHGTAVAALMAGQYPVSVGFAAVMAKPMASTFSEFDDSKISFFHSNQYGPEASIINISMANLLGSDVSTRYRWAKTFKSFPSKSIIVKASGNDYPDRDLGIPENIILVGSTDVDGFPSRFSQEGKELIISAPSSSGKTGIKSFNELGNLVAFGGTSGATPMVSAALSNVLSLLPNITYKEIITILKLSAIKTNGFINQTPYKGAGVMNAYKLFRIALKLSTEWPSNRALLQDISTYDFSLEAKNLLISAKELLNGLNCEKEEKAFLKLREAFFLDSTNSETRQLLATLYKKYSYEEEAKFYDTLLNTTPPRQQNRDYLTAVVNGDLKVVNEYYSIWQKSDQSSRPHSFFSNLELSIKNAQIELVHFFMEMGHKVDRSNSIYLSLNLCSYADQSVLDVLKTVVTKDPKVIGFFKGGELIAKAIYSHCNIDLLKFLVQMGGEVKAANGLVYKAVISGNIPGLKFLLEQGAPPSELTTAIFEFDLEAFNLLVDAGANNIREAKKKLKQNIKNYKNEPEKVKILKQMMSKLKNSK